MDVHIREALEEDFPAIHALNKNGFGYDYDLYATRDRLRLILNKPENRIFVAEADGEVIGYIHAADYDCTYSDSLKNVLSIVVDERARGLGAGRKLLSATESWAKEEHCAGVRLVSGFDREDAHKFYRACGYAVRKHQKNFIRYF